MQQSTTLRARLAMLMRAISAPAWVPSVVSRVVWLGLGAFFAALTARVLFWDVSRVSDLTPDQVLTLGALVGAIASGIWFWRMLTAFKLLTALGLAIAFCGATAYCMIGAAGRSDETTFAKNAAARQVNSDRTRLDRDLKEAKTRYQAALKAEEEECASGAGTKCTSKRETTKLRRADVETAEGKLVLQPAEQRENGKLKRAAELIAHFAGRDQVYVERGLALLWPFVPPTICELLTIVFLHLGFGHGRQRVREPTGVSSRTEGNTASVHEPKAPNRPHEPMNRAKLTGKPALKKAQAERDLITYIALHGHVPSQDFLRERWGLRSKGTVSGWLSEWERQGLIERRQEGKRKVTTAAN